MIMSSVDLTEMMNRYESKNASIDEVDTTLTVLSKQSHRLPTK